MAKSADYQGFFKSRYMENILEFRKYYPDNKTLIIDYSTVNNFDGEAGGSILEHPERELKYLKEALGALDLSETDPDIPDDDMSKAEIAIRGLSYTTPIFKLGEAHVNKLTSIEGRITRLAPKYQKMTKAAFKCGRCGDVIFVPQPDGLFIEPFECESEACGRKGHFKLLLEQSEYEDQQKIGLQDLNESAKPGQPLSEIIVLLRTSDLIRSIPGMGAQCVITGIVRLQQKISKAGKSSEFKLFLEAIHIEPKETEIDLSISEAEKQEFHEAAARNDIMQILVKSTAPEILGYDRLKEALLGATVSGSDNPVFREYMHVIIIGDPGTAKTMLLKFIREIVPRSQYSAGKGSSMAGLTVALVKDDISGSGWTAQAGVLVLADGGMAVIDEADKLEPEDHQALNTALEEGFIEIHKAGINQKFPANCSVIALCNPKKARFDEYESFTKQITIPGDTLSRFDLIFKILDKPNEKIDREVGQHQVNQFARYEGRSQEPAEMGILSKEKLSKYLQYAKTFKPQTTPEIGSLILEYFITLRKPDDTGTVAVTRRLLNGLYRLTKAIAKLRLSDTCSIQDVEKAIQIHKVSLEAMRDPTTGKIDSDIVLGIGQSQRDRYRQIRGIVQELQGNNGSQVHFNEIVSKASDIGLNRDQLSNDLDYLKHAKEIIEVSNGFFRVIL